MITDIRTTEPAEHAVTLNEAKLHLRVDGNDEDTLISGLIVAAEQLSETFLSRSLITQNRRAKFDAFPGGVSLLAHLSGYPRGGSACGSDDATIVLPEPIDGEDITIKYLDTNGVEQSVDKADFFVDADSKPARIIPTPGKVWPTTGQYPGAVRVDYVAGYGDASDVPQCIKNGMMLTIGHLYANKESVVTGTIATELPRNAEWCMQPERVERFG